MTYGLSRAVLPPFAQTLGAVAGLIGKARAFAAERGIGEEALIGERLAPDMLPFGYQVKSTVVHSVGAIEGVRRGSFAPDRSAWATTFDGLAERIAAAIEAVAAIDPAEVDGFVGRDMAFQRGETAIPFLAEEFLTGFSLPNLHFHATTAYDILRWQGAPLGKPDYLGRVPVRAA